MGLLAGRRHVGWMGREPLYHLVCATLRESQGQAEEGTLWPKLPFSQGQEGLLVPALHPPSHSLQPPWKEQRYQPLC